MTDNLKKLLQVGAQMPVKVVLRPEQSAELLRRIGTNDDIDQIGRDCALAYVKGKGPWKDEEIKLPDAERLVLANREENNDE